MQTNLLSSQLHGVIPIYKPLGMVSKDVSRWLTKRLGKQKLGHVGTLDPLAEGLLPVLFGRATKLQDYYVDMHKSYNFDVSLGIATTTLDCEGEQVEQQPLPASMTQNLINQICREMEGEFLQKPPIYSAIKFRGKPLYEYARKGQEAKVDLDSLTKKVFIKKLKCVGFASDKLSFSIECSKGTYVRVVGDCIARKLNTCGHITRLVRTASAGFDLTTAISLDHIDENLDRFESLLSPIESTQLSLPRWRADKGAVKRLQNGLVHNLGIRDFLENCLDRNDSISFDTAETILLLDQQKRCFGIGRVSVDQDQRLAIKLKRGL